jgi:hypothetical protein
MVDAARVTPTVSQPIRVDWASWGEQLLAHETPMIEAAANFGLNLVEGMIPGGMVLKMFVSERVVDQLVQQGVAVLGHALDSIPETSVDPVAHPVAGYVANMFNLTAPKMASAIGPKLDDLIKAGLAKAGIKV